MATNTGKGSRKGSVDDSTQVRNPAKLEIGERRIRPEPVKSRVEHIQPRGGDIVYFGLPEERAKEAITAITKEGLTMVYFMTPGCQSEEDAAAVFTPEDLCDAEDAALINAVYGKKNPHRHPKR